MTNYEITNINQQIVEKFEEQVKEKGLPNMVYTMNRGGKILVSYNKDTLEQLRLDLGLIKIAHNPIITPLGDGNATITVRVDLLTPEGQIIASANGYGELKESPKFKNSNDRMPDMLRLGAVIEKRGLSQAITPLLIRLGLDYPTLMYKQGQKLQGEYQHTSNVEDIETTEIKPERTELNDIEIEQTYKRALEKEEVFKEVASTLKVYHNIEVDSKDYLTRALVSLITVQQLKAIIKNVVNSKE